MSTVIFLSQRVPSEFFGVPSAASWQVVNLTIDDGTRIGVSRVLGTFGDETEARRYMDLVLASASWEATPT